MIIPRDRFSVNLDVSADVTESINRFSKSTDDVFNPPAKKSSEIVTGLLSFFSESINAGLYIYKQNLEYYKEKCKRKVKYKISMIPDEEITAPDVGILGETIENLKYNLDKDYLVDLYSSIIAKNIDKRTKDSVHPAFISTIKNLSFFDIKFLEALYKYHNRDNEFLPIITLTIGSDSDAMDKTFRTEKYFVLLDDFEVNIDELGLIIENLIKQNLITLDFMTYFRDSACYENLKTIANNRYQYTFASLEKAYNCKCFVDMKSRGVLRLTNFGEQLLQICLSD